MQHRGPAVLVLHGIVVIAIVVTLTDVQAALDLDDELATVLRRAGFTIKRGCNARLAT